MCCLSNKWTKGQHLTASTVPSHHTPTHPKSHCGPFNPHSSSPLVQVYICLFPTLFIYLPSPVLLRDHFWLKNKQTKNSLYTTNTMQMLLALGVHVFSLLSGCISLLCFNFLILLQSLSFSVAHGYQVPIRSGFSLESTLSGQALPDAYGIWPCHFLAKVPGSSQVESPEG